MPWLNKNTVLNESAYYANSVLIGNEQSLWRLFVI